MKIKSNDHAALNAAFAEKVAGWRIHHRNTALWCKADEADGLMRSGAMAVVGELNFTHSADAVLPWLEKRTEGWLIHTQPTSPRHTCWLVSEHTGRADSVPHAAVIALLRAHGVEVED